MLKETKLIQLVQCIMELPATVFQVNFS